MTTFPTCDESKVRPGEECHLQVLRVLPETAADSRLGVNEGKESERYLTTTHAKLTQPQQWLVATLEKLPVPVMRREIEAYERNMGQDAADAVRRALRAKGVAA